MGGHPPKNSLFSFFGTILGVLQYFLNKMEKPSSASYSARHGDQNDTHFVGILQNIFSSIFDQSAVRNFGIFSNVSKPIMSGTRFDQRTILSIMMVLSMSKKLSVKSLTALDVSKKYIEFLT